MRRCAGSKHLSQAPDTNDVAEPKHVREQVGDELRLLVALDCFLYKGRDDRLKQR